MAGYVRILLRRLLPGGLAALALAPAVAAAADTRSQLTMLINDRGAVEVVDRWSGLKQEAGVFNYFSAAREIGVVPVKVRNFGFTINFTTRSYLRYEDGIYHFVTPDFYYEDGPLDVELTLTYPPNLVFLGAEPPPDYEGDGVLNWSLADASHQIVMARFERVGPFVMPGRTGPDWQVDPAVLRQLSAEELPATADEVLKEFENIISVARASQSTDPDFLRVMDKLLAKFYYILSINGLLLDYHYGPTDAGEAPAAGEQDSAEEQDGGGTLSTGGGAAARNDD